MSERVKSNAFEKVVPENLYLIQKTTDLLETVVKIWENRFTAAIFQNGRQRLQGRNLRWPYIQIFL